MRLCIKIGGAQLAEPAARARFARSVAAARDAGHELILVHGGGDQIRSLSSRLGIEDRYHLGLRITDADTAKVAVMVLAGAVNKSLVQTLTEIGLAAVGLCGADGSCFQARKLDTEGADLGFVGEVHQVDAKLPDALCAAGFTPVLATVAPLAPGLPGDPGALYNINADHAAAPLATALSCHALLFLTDVAGVLDADGRVCDSLSSELCDAMRQTGTLSGGMLPKVAAALAAARDLPGGLVKIAPAAGDNAVLNALEDSTGTRFVAPQPLAS